MPSRKIDVSTDFRRLVALKKGCRGLRNGFGSVGSNSTMFTSMHLVVVRFFVEGEGIGLRPDYLEYKMGTIKTYSARNNFLSSWFVQIP